MILASTVTLINGCMSPPPKVNVPQIWDGASCVFNAFTRQVRVRVTRSQTRISVPPRKELRDLQVCALLASTNSCCAI